MTLNLFRTIFIFYCQPKISNHIMKNWYLLTTCSEIPILGYDFFFQTKLFWCKKYRHKINKQDSLWLVKKLVKIWNSGIGKSETIWWAALVIFLCVQNYLFKTLPNYQRVQKIEIVEAFYHRGTEKLQSSWKLLRIVL